MTTRAVWKGGGKERGRKKITITHGRLKKWKGRLSGKARDSFAIGKVREVGPLKYCHGFL